jgi:phosphoketolase
MRKAVRFKELLRTSAPQENRRMGANPHSQRRPVLRDLRTPRRISCEYGVAVPYPGGVEEQDMARIGALSRDFYN